MSDTPRNIIDGSLVTSLNSIQNHRDKADAIIQSLNDAGFAIVPKIATDEMVNAATLELKNILEGESCYNIVGFILVREAIEKANGSYEI